ncbi:MAG: carboxypeptidase regulatory-like domain-containing protein [Acidobacteria bacterium]|nr:carboxypeptidase regulatory-like domain-containing protein [Acidobacteriota bacterium]
MGRRGLLLTLASLLVTLASAARAEGCTCMMPGPPCQAFGEASAVFVGTVTGVVSKPLKSSAGGEGPGWATRTFKFAVAEAFSGVEGTTAEVSTGFGGGDCGYTFVKGTSYIVYASRSKDGTLGTGICSRTRPALGATEDLAFLRGLAGRPPGVTVSGRVARRDDDRAGEGDKAGLAGLRLTVEGEGVRREIVTDAAGRYSLSGLRPGNYKITLRAPDGLTDQQPEREVQVADRGCAVEDFFVFDNGRVSGRVTDAEGKSTARMTVALVNAVASDADRQKSGILTSADEEGRYKFEGLPAGRYLLGVRLSSYASPGDLDQAYPRTYYPGVERPEEAEVIELKAGEELKGRDLRLPPRRVETSIGVKVVWADGTPVPGAQVIYRDVTYGEPPINHGEQANERGEATLKGYAGSVYRIWASSNRPYQDAPSGRDEPMERPEPVTINANSAVETVTLVITKLR